MSLTSEFILNWVEAINLEGTAAPVGVTLPTAYCSDSQWHRFSPFLVRVPHGIICFYCPLYFRVDSELESECQRELHKCHEGESRLD